MELADMQLNWEQMRQGILHQPELFTQAPRALYDEVCARLDGPPPSRIYLAGCGDSYYCGLAARYAIEEWSGVAVDALESMEFSRYAVRNAPSDALAVVVSNSGEVARSIEAVRFARQQGLTTIGVTYNPQSRLAQETERVVQYDYRDLGFGPGTMSYLASMLTQMIIGLRVGELTGRLTSRQADEQLARLGRLADPVARAVSRAEVAAKQVAERMPARPEVFILGAGPNYGTALFGMAKFIESARINAVGQELEEWAHEQYFVCREGTFTIVLAPPGAALARAREQLRAVRDVGGTAIAICQEDDLETAELADMVIPVPDAIDELLSPLVYAVGLEWLAYHFAVAQGAVMLGFDDENRKQVNFRQIFHSQIPEELPPLGTDGSQASVESA